MVILLFSSFLLSSLKSPNFLIFLCYKWVSILFQGSFLVFIVVRHHRYILNRVGDRLHLYLTPLLIAIDVLLLLCISSVLCYLCFPATYNIYLLILQFPYISFIGSHVKAFFSSSSTTSGLFIVRL